MSTEFWVQYIKMDKVTKIKSLLAEHIGVDADDIKDEDSFSEDLHMGPMELVDFTEALKKIGFDTSAIDFSTIDTVGELLEALQLYE